MFLTNPVFECFNLLVKSSFEGNPEILAREALRSVVGEAGLGDWEVVPVHASSPLELDLVPSFKEPLPVDRAWSLCYELRQQAAVADAEPSFELVLDTVPDDDELEELAEHNPELAQALREQELDDDEEIAFEESIDVTAAFLEAMEPLDPEDREWSPKLVRAPEAWEVAPATAEGRARGEGIVIAHPDSGHRAHRELADLPADNRLRTDLDHDFIDGGDDTDDEDGGHGLGTASVIMSLDNRRGESDAITGVAPAAQLVPLRVAKKKFLIPVPVLLKGGMRRLRDALYKAIDNDWPVVSISLGGLKNRSVRRAVQKATQQNMIVCAAAGNYVRFVVWPAKYPEVIAVAGCTVRRTKWRGSSRGSAVDVTAPAKKVWKAAIKGSNQQVVEQSKGTSFAVATTAGAVALWLAHHGRQFLIDGYSPEFTLTNVFRWVLARSADPPPPKDDGKFGVGILNAERLLLQRLPTLDELRASTAPILESMARAAPFGAGGIEEVEEAFEEASPDAIRAVVAGMGAMPVEEMEGRLRGVGDELAFHILTTPALREQVMAEPEDEILPTTSVREGMLLLAPTSLEMAAAREEIRSLPGVSAKLRRRLEL